MKAKNTHHFLKIRKRPWYTWLLRLFWLVWIIFWLDVAWGSWKELEPRAGVIALSIFLLSLLVGIFLWLWARRKAKKAGS